MIIGLGLDLVEIFRVESSWRRFGRRFAERILHPLELPGLDALDGPSNSGGSGRKLAEYLAARFAAKEAAVKALGSGFSGSISPQTMYVHKLPSGQPEMVFVGPALEKARQLGANGSFLSITHSKNTAAAVLILTR